MIAAQHRVETGQSTGHGRATRRDRPGRGRPGSRQFRFSPNLPGRRDIPGPGPSPSPGPGPGPGSRSGDRTRPARRHRPHLRLRLRRPGQACQAGGDIGIHGYTGRREP
ncbi:hypothetical protein OG819_00015 [Streptomyces sp. NBC_01549]|uniref:hypothetical protein n=1 Tax=Streptomyces sp. NBC_01549 TaxID=2975874 RepID=UPI0022504873|nr:hypothetical protein [Streptomyces sp. NBC_01549]MCX4588191.1 hypothetical protein [Streptomyces sp. NBC_01549]